MKFTKEIIAFVLFVALFVSSSGKVIGTKDAEESKIPPQTQTNIVMDSDGSPFLQMCIRDGHSIDGGIVSSAYIGQRIALDVVMQNTTIYDFFVHSCYAHDGTDTPKASISVMDQNGCAVELARAVDMPTFFMTPTLGGAKHVYVHMHGFQFTTSEFVYFVCEVQTYLQECARPQCKNDSNIVKANCSTEDVSLDQELHHGTVQSMAAREGGGLKSNLRLETILQIKQ